MDELMIERQMAAAKDEAAAKILWDGMSAVAKQEEPLCSIQNAEDYCRYLQSILPQLERESELETLSEKLSNARRKVLAISEDGGEEIAIALWNELSDAEKKGHVSSITSAEEYFAYLQENASKWEREVETLEMKHMLCRVESRISGQIDNLTTQHKRLEGKVEDSLRMNQDLCAICVADWQFVTVAPISSKWEGGCCGDNLVHVGGDSGGLL
jgi:molybdopterin converting factor small subunit